MHGHLKVKFDMYKNYVIKVSEVMKPILIIKSTSCTNFSNLFLNKLYMFRTFPLSIIRNFSLYTQQWYMSYRFAVCNSEGLLMMDRGNCAKCVEFDSKNKFEKLVHLVGFIIRIYHDARSPERKKKL